MGGRDGAAGAPPYALVRSPDSGAPCTAAPRLMRSRVGAFPTATWPVAGRWCDGRGRWGWAWPTVAGGAAVPARAIATGVETGGTPTSAGSEDGAASLASVGTRAVAAAGGGATAPAACAVAPSRIEDDAVLEPTPGGSKKSPVRTALAPATAEILITTWPLTCHCR